MTELRFRMALRTFLSRRPFRRFIIELNSGSRLLISHPETIYLRDGMAVHCPIGDSPLHFLFDHESVCLLFDPEEKPADQ